jgi:hypothetical protein
MGLWRVCMSAHLDWAVDVQMLHSISSSDCFVVSTNKFISILCLSCHSRFVLITSLLTVDCYLACPQFVSTRWFCWSMFCSYELQNINHLLPEYLCSAVCVCIAFICFCTSNCSDSSLRQLPLTVSPESTMIETYPPAPNQGDPIDCYVSCVANL